MGVAGSGKSTLAAALAERLSWPMIEGDDFHSDENKARMRAGVPLSDADREGWLRSLARELQQHPDGAVLTCSALKRSYRDLLRAASPGLAICFFGHLGGRGAVACARSRPALFPAGTFAESV